MCFDSSSCIEMSEVKSGHVYTIGCVRYVGGGEDWDEIPHPYHEWHLEADGHYECGHCGINKAQPKYECWCGETHWEKSDSCSCGCSGPHVKIRNVFLYPPKISVEASTKKKSR